MHMRAGGGGAAGSAGSPGHGRGRTHGPIPELRPAQRRRIRIALAAVTVPLLIATLLGLWLLWPPADNPMGSLPLRGEGAEFVTAEVTAITPIGGDTIDPFLGADVRALLTSGIGAGTEVPIQVPGEILLNGLAVGDQITVIFTADAMGTGSPYVFYDFVRGPALLWLFLGYLGVVMLVARWRGLAAVLGLGASLAVSGIFILPAIMSGTNPLLVVLVGSSAMMFLAVYLAHGISIRTTTALLGTFAGLMITVFVGFISISGARLTGAQSDVSLVISTVFPELNLRHLLLCGLIVAGLGALNDVTITQASAVWELHAVDPTLSRARLWRGGMRIGRDHIASTVYTLAFAYVGTALPLLLVAALIDRTFLDFLTASEIAEEIVRTLVSSIGLVLAIPLTTLLGVALVPRQPASPLSDAGTSHPPAAILSDGGGDVGKQEGAGLEGAPGTGTVHGTEAGA